MRVIRVIILRPKTIQIRAFLGSGRLGTWGGGKGVLGWTGRRFVTADLGAQLQFASYLHHRTRLKPATRGPFVRAARNCCLRQRGWNACRLSALLPHLLLRLAQNTQGILA